MSENTIDHSRRKTSSVSVIPSLSVDFEVCLSKTVKDTTNEQTFSEQTLVIKVNYSPKRSSVH